MSDLIREVEEDIRQERWMNLAKKYGPYVIAAVVVIVGATGGYVFWQQWQAQQREAATEQLVNAVVLRRDEGVDASVAALKSFASEAGTDQGAVADLIAAGLLLQDGKIEEARALYDQVSRQGSVTAPLQQLATLMVVTHSLSDGDPKALQTRLAPLVVEDNPWRYSALELMALLAVRQNDMERARSLLAEISSDSAAPPTLRDRAKSLAAVYGAEPS